MTIKRMMIETASTKEECNVEIYNCGTGEILSGCFKGELLTPYQLENGGCNVTKITDLTPDPEPDPEPDSEPDLEADEDWEAAIEEFQLGWGTMPGHP